jgi:hypothetical protein
VLQRIDDVQEVVEGEILRRIVEVGLGLLARRIQPVRILHRLVGYLKAYFGHRCHPPRPAPTLAVRSSASVTGTSLRRINPRIS